MFHVKTKRNLEHCDLQDSVNNYKSARRFFLAFVAESLGVLARSAWRAELVSHYIEISNGHRIFEFLLWNLHNSVVDV